ncbi:MAG: 30S ribosome-binding factor RbfA [Candidatus Omnitrophota bacterium]
MARRAERVAEAIRRLAGEIVHSQLRDPRIKGFVTITKVEITPDLRFAKIYYTTICDDKKKELIARGLKSAKNYIRKRIGDELKLRYVPDISLRVDENIEYSKRIDSILDKLNKEAPNEGDRENSKGD